ncbi:hypothetical protein HYPBUDRAFT_158104 [Hyphopichia burtonii NRRL Y-1933]|uniref:RNA polymerase II subunit A C-terminal domain phosphatase n=1 Tax=Hyphopichia burtonii NRRL Y-1933 TaxID=984485 RepID=A0A1E4RFP0_9ASCO|nr:hypothetical protein HYPBUDRAFT_158104 [Hyphopichia burtonii NRRL Y-1933]ODV66079.1 hypothetical protein HYPBUDRAFT_158104 [Hyphopichia burtonii NRRL Y-1933]
MSELTPITLPQSVPFPVSITAILYRDGDFINRHSTIFKYKYWDYQDDPNSKEETPPKIRVERIGTFESPIEGELTRMNVHIHQEIPHSGVELCSIKEPCGHAVQYGGLCALCGKSVEDEKDYSGYSYEDRATIAMSHDNTGLKISLDEATKIEESTTSRLTKDNKLILVVDLDQTVIHATVDPTVGEWQADPSNPNYPAVKDVQSFCLEEDPILPPDWAGPRPAPTKCWYYVKLRPGLQEFLAQVAKKFELHIYTMATRNYALAIAKIIDPEAYYFGDRILSRDESGSLTHKNLKRLFPVDQSMVVIIDDRGDVWQWEKNLIKVVPYDFFVGIGDINSSFLPKKNGQITGPTKKRKTLAQLEALEDDKPNDENEKSQENDKEDEQEEIISTQDSEASHDSSSPVDRILELGGGEDNANLLMEQSLTRNQSLEQQQHDRPLAKLQHNLDKMIHEHDLETSSRQNSSSPEDSDNESKVEEEEEDNLLYDDDNELYSLEKALGRIHSQYYEKYQEYQKHKIMEKPDLTTIIPQLKSKCLEGITVLFSGILPLGINIETTDIVIWCRQFGVNVVNEVYSDQVTHVVCRDPNGQAFKLGLTLKVRVARKIIPNVRIVNPDWLFACLSSWSKVDETPYLIECSEEDWHVEDKDVTKYQRAIELQRAKNEARMFNRPRFDSVGSLEEYDLDNANQEVDDFLAGIDDDDDEEEEEEEEEEEADEEEDESTNHQAGVDSFIKDAYKSTKKRKFDDENSQTHDEPEVDLDELEQELLDGFEDLDEE